MVCEVELELELSRVNERICKSKPIGFFEVAPREVNVAMIRVRFRHVDFPTIDNFGSENVSDSDINYSVTVELLIVWHCLVELGFGGR